MKQPSIFEPTAAELAIAAAAAPAHELFPLNGGGHVWNQERPAIVPDQLVSTAGELRQERVTAVACGAGDVALRQVG